MRNKKNAQKIWGKSSFISLSNFDGGGTMPKLDLEKRIFLHKAYLENGRDPKAAIDAFVAHYGGQAPDIKLPKRLHQLYEETGGLHRRPYTPRKKKVHFPSLLPHEKAIFLCVSI